MIQSSAGAIIGLMITNLLIFLAISTSSADPIRVAVIDTGIDSVSKWENAESLGLKKPILCKKDHTVFAGKTDKDKMGHGTHVAGLIAKYAGDSDYCLISYKAFTNSSAYDPIETSNAALKKAIEDGVDLINYSAGGYLYNEEECSLVKKALDKGIGFIAAIGNDAKNTDFEPYYPAMCDPRIAVVENVSEKGELAPTSNYSVIRLIKFSENGVDALSLAPGGKFEKMTGTSQATAIATGKIVKLLHEKRKNERSAKKTTK